MHVICRQAPDDATRTTPDIGSKSSPVIVCRNCSYQVTTPDERMKMNGAFLHTFANPHGHVFEIGCFQQAWGCIPASVSSLEFTWFAGYAWQIGICANCGAHLGWIFTSGTHRFFGLIVDKLRFP